MRICLVPLRFEPKNPAATMRRLDDVLEAALEKKPDLVCLPEHFATGYVWESEDLRRFGETIPGPTTDRISDIARKHRLFFAFGLVEKSGSEFFNSAVLISRTGGIVLRHRKIQEPAPYARGVAVPSADTEIGRISILICGDLLNEEAARMLDAASDLLIAISAGTYKGTYEEYVEQHHNKEGVDPRSHRYKPYSVHGHTFSVLCHNKERFSQVSHYEAIARLGVRTGYVSVLEPELPLENRFFGVGAVIDAKGNVVAQSSCPADDPLVWDL